MNMVQYEMVEHVALQSGCEWWSTQPVGLRAGSKVLSHANILFLCDECLEVVKSKLRSRIKEGTEDKENQAATDTTQDKSAQKMTKDQVITNRPGWFPIPWTSRHSGTPGLQGSQIINKNKNNTTVPEFTP
ncbi:hypothetical protein O3P69_011412 [Scylla paramamosain]|uniref:Uncharacterized protein n=1 Tax=Scylla paramamosain TaxID=85552 RepID=A0AAW0T5I4_SCYPA